MEDYNEAEVADTAGNLTPHVGAKRLTKPIRLSPRHLV